MSEPREFYLYSDDADNLIVYRNRSNMDWNHCIHVIEKSAYDARKAENEELTKIIAQTSYDPESTYRRLENLRKENELMRERLIVALKNECVAFETTFNTVDEYVQFELAKLGKKEPSE